ncbi:hypothetical protein DAEQUDRAFT_671208, partial [Daedalea quercina L-15889]
RRCPGSMVAESAFFIAVTHLLAIFNISHPTDKHGHEITEPVPYTDEHISHPQLFKCDIRQRTEAAAKLVSQLVTSY